MRTLTVTGLLRCRLAQSMERLRAYDRDRRDLEAQAELAVVLRHQRVLRELEAKLVAR